MIYLEAKNPEICGPADLLALCAGLGTIGTRPTKLKGTRAIVPNLGTDIRKGGNSTVPPSKKKANHAFVRKNEIDVKKARASNFSQESSFIYKTATKTLSGTHTVASFRRRARRMPLHGVRYNRPLSFPQAHIRKLRLEDAPGACRFIVFATIGLSIPLEHTYGSFV